MSLAKRRYDEIVAQHESISTALDQIYKENDLAAKLHKQLEHEKIVLDERISVSSIKEYQSNVIFSTPLWWLLFLSIGVRVFIHFTVPWESGNVPC